MAAPVLPAQLQQLRRARHRFIRHIHQHQYRTRDRLHLRQRRGQILRLADDVQHQVDANQRCALQQS